MKNREKTPNAKASENNAKLFFFFWFDDWQPMDSDWQPMDSDLTRNASKRTSNAVLTLESESQFGTEIFALNTWLVL